MLIAGSRESAIERLIGWLTIALGVGAFIPRPGLGLYALLEANHSRIVTAVVMLCVGIAAIVCTFIRAYASRFVSLVLVLLCWAYLATRFIDGGLWGATFQAVVVIGFTNSVIWRLWHRQQEG